jgi:hypothetical protein
MYVRHIKFKQCFGSGSGQDQPATNYKKRKNGNKKYVRQVYKILNSVLDLDLVLDLERTSHTQLYEKEKRKQTICTPGP